MDPITQTIVWGVIWFVLAWVGPGILAWGFSVLGLGASATTRRQSVGPAVIGFVVGIILALALFVFSVIQVILHIVDLVQHLTG